MGISHSKSVRSLPKGGYPRSIAKHVIEATVRLEGISAKVVKCKANKAFAKGNVVVKAGQTFFLVESSKFAGLYYVVLFNEDRSSWQCSCGAGCKTHAHHQAVQEWIITHVVSKKAEAKKQAQRTEQAEKVAAQAEYFAEKKLNAFRVGDAYDIEGPHKVTTDQRKQAA